MVILLSPQLSACCAMLRWAYLYFTVFCTCVCHLDCYHLGEYHSSCLPVVWPLRLLPSSSTVMYIDSLRMQVACTGCHSQIISGFSKSRPSQVFWALHLHLMILKCLILIYCAIYSYDTIQCRWWMATEAVTVFVGACDMSQKIKKYCHAYDLVMHTKNREPMLCIMRISVEIQSMTMSEQWWWEKGFRDRCNCLQTCWGYISGKYGLYNQTSTKGKGTKEWPWGKEQWRTRLSPKQRQRKRGKSTVTIVASLIVWPGEFQQCQLYCILFKGHPKLKSQHQLPLVPPYQVFRVLLTVRIQTFSVGE